MRYTLFSNILIQHAQHAEHNIVLLFLFVDLDTRGILSKQRHTSSNFFHYLLGHHSRFFSPPLSQNSKGNPLGGVLNTGDVWQKFAFFIEITVYLGKGTRYAHGYSGYISNMNSYVAD